MVCAEGVVIEVRKRLITRHDTRIRIQVRGSFYVYHAWHRPRRLSLFRYCTAHGLEDLHVHRYDLRTGAETSQPRIPLETLPTLTAAIIEAIALAAQVDARQEGPSSDGPLALHYEVVATPRSVPRG